MAEAAQAIRDLRADRDRWKETLGSEMPAEFKDWHEKSDDEKPMIAAQVIRNLQNQEHAAWETQRPAEKQ